VYVFGIEIQVRLAFFKSGRELYLRDWYLLGLTDRQLEALILAEEDESEFRYDAETRRNRRVIVEKEMLLTLLQTVKPDLQIRFSEIYY
jgi:hypothetical protein